MMNIRRPFIGGALSVLIILGTMRTTPAGEAERSATCRAPLEAWTEIDLYFGRNIGSGGRVSERQFQRFLTEVVVELKRTTWPTRREVQGTTLVVIVTVFVFAVFLFAVDYVLSQGVTKIFEAFR